VAAAATQASWRGSPSHWRTWRPRYVMAAFSPVSSLCGLMLTSTVGAFLFTPDEPPYSLLVGHAHQARYRHSAVPACSATVSVAPPAHLPHHALAAPTPSPLHLVTTGHPVHAVLPGSGQRAGGGAGAGALKRRRHRRSGGGSGAVSDGSQRRRQRRNGRSAAAAAAAGTRAERQAAGAAQVSGRVAVASACWVHTACPWQCRSSHLASAARSVLLCKATSTST
jgi:hypothetical protein